MPRPNFPSRFINITRGSVAVTASTRLPVPSGEASSITRMSAAGNSDLTAAIRDSMVPDSL